MRTSRYSLRRLLRLGVIPLRFCEFFVGKKNKTRISCALSLLAEHPTPNRIAGFRYSQSVPEPCGRYTYAQSEATGG